MASEREYMEFILEQLSELDDVTYRYMMGEYIFYYRDKIFGGIYDDRFLVKNVESARDYMGSVRYEIPFPGAHEMILVDDVDDREYLAGLVESMYDELPEPKKKKKRSRKE